MSSFAQADSNYRLAIEAPGRELAAAFASARAVGPADLTKDELTEAVLLRLKSFLTTQDAIKAGLNKVYAAPAADFLVETVESGSDSNYSSSVQFFIISPLTDKYMRCQHLAATSMRVYQSVP